MIKGGSYEQMHVKKAVSAHGGPWCGFGRTNSGLVICGTCDAEPAV